MAGVSTGEDGADGVPVDGPETVAEKRLLASLSRQARAVNLARVARLVELLDSSEAGALDEAGWHEAENLAHQVIGSAGTFGYPAASVDAVAIEEYFASGSHRPPGRARSSGPAPDDVAVRRILDRLRAEFSG